jgi:mannosyltransferase PIG-V
VTNLPAARDPTPLWVWIVDGAAVGFACMALWITVAGGVRQVLFGRIVSLTSPLVCVYITFCLLLVRHLLRPQPSVASRLSQLRGSLASRPTLAAALRAFLATRPLVLLVGCFAVGTFGMSAKPGFRLSHDEVANLPARFDAGWYGEIALDGYHWAGTFELQRNIAFFPAAPFLMRPLGLLFNMNEQGLPREQKMLRVLWAGTCLSLAAFLWALYYLVRLGSDLIGFERAAGAALLLAAYPFALFYSAPYSESLFLLGAVAAFFHFRRGEWMAAACWGLLVGLTRPNGCFLSVPLALLAIQQARRTRAATNGHEPECGGVRPVSVRLLVAAMPAVGMALFTVYLHGLTGVWFAWARSHEAWGRTFQGLTPATGFFASLAEQPLMQVIMRAPFDALNALGLLFALSLVWPVFTRLGAVWGVFVLVNLLPPLLSGGVLSIGRLTSTLFPLFLALAVVIPSPSVPAWATAFGTAQGLCTALFFTWRDVY